MRSMILPVTLACAGMIPAAPAVAQIMVVGSSVQESGADPGGRYDGRIQLRNQGAEPRAVRVYQTDYLFYADGTSLYPEPGSHPRSNADWIRATPTDLMVPPGQTVEVSYEVAVPPEPGLAGTYWSMVMVELLPDDAGPDPGAPGVGLRTTVRFGIQVATHVGVVPHQLRLDEPRVTTDDSGVRHLEFDLVNDGEAGYRPMVSVEVYDEAGSLASSMEVQRGLLYPGTSAVQRVSLEGLPAGAYEAVVVVDTGVQDVFGGQFTLTLDAPG